MVERKVIGIEHPISDGTPEQFVSAAIKRYFDLVGVRTSGVILLALTHEGMELKYFGSQVRDDIDVENAVLYAADMIRQARA